MDGDGLHFEKVSLTFSNFPYSSLRQTKKYTMDYSSCIKLIFVLVLNSIARISASVKVGKKDFFKGFWKENSKSAVRELV